MPSTILDHVNLRTSRLNEMVGFYTQVLGLTVGERPPFPFGGAWLYAGGQPILHLVEVDADPRTSDPRIEHFALKTQGLEAFLKRLADRDIAYRISIVPELEIRQVNIHDPDGNHIHVDFDRSEAIPDGAGHPRPTTG